MLVRKLIGKKVSRKNALENMNVSNKKNALENINISDK
jgi:hypothetical protein